MDVATWAKSKRRFIRREELLAFLAEDSPGQVRLEMRDEIVKNCPKLFYLQGESEGLDRLSLSNPRRAPAVLPSLQVTFNIQNIKSPLFVSKTDLIVLTLQDMLDLSRLSPGHRKRSSPPSPQQDEEMEHSPQSKRSRKN